jgi:S-formylglutathione hydrolase FrmB
MKLRNLVVLTVAALCSIAANAFSTDTIMVPTKYLEKAMRVTVIVPEAAAKHTDLPTVYLLNGHGGDYRSWGKIRTDLGRYADYYGMVFVMPSGLNSWYWDSPINPKMQMESFFVNDLVPYINTHYPVANNADKRAITGLSMGGHGAFWLGLHHPDIWKNIGSTSGGVNIIPFPERWNMANSLGKYEDNPQLWQEHTIINQIELFKANKQNIIFDCGTDDVFTAVNADLHQALLDAKVPHDYISRPGKHNIDYWHNSILYQLLFFQLNFKKAAATPTK